MIKDKNQKIKELEQDIESQNKIIWQLEEENTEFAKTVEQNID